MTCLTLPAIVRVMNENNQYVTLRELARTTRLPARWLQREADSKSIPCLRAGKRRMFDIAAVMKALADRQAEEVHR